MRACLFIFVLGACSGPSNYKAMLVNGMDGSPLADVRVVAKASPAPSDLTCQVREATSGKDGSLVLEELCRDQPYVLRIPDPTLQLSGTNVVTGQDEMETVKHQAWRSPDGHGLYRLSGDSLAVLPTFSDVAIDTAIDGTPVRYPDMKPTGKVITVGEGEHLIISGKKAIQRIKIHPLVANDGRVRLQGDTIRNHVFIGVEFDAASKPTKRETSLDSAKVSEVLIRGEGMQFIAHDALPAGRYALLGDNDTRVTILDFGGSQEATQ